MRVSMRMSTRWNSGVQAVFWDRTVDIGAVEFGSFFVNSFLDTVDVNPGDGIVADATGISPYVPQLWKPMHLAGDSVIILGAGTYALTITRSRR